MKRIVLMLLMVVAFVATADAQGFLKRLKDRAVNAAENAVSNKVDDKVRRETDKAMDDALDGKETSESNDADNKDVEDTPQEVEAEYQQSDFVPGTAVFFEDNLQGEQMG